jgi:hypothetical protein
VMRARSPASGRLAILRSYGLRFANSARSRRSAALRRAVS